MPGGTTLRWKRVWNGKFLKWEKSAGQYRAPSFVEKFNALYSQMDCLDMGAFWENYIDNQAGDVLGGFVSQKNKDIPDKLRGDTPFGIEFGPAL